MDLNNWSFGKNSLAASAAPPADESTKRFMLALFTARPAVVRRVTPLMGAGGSFCRTVHDGVNRITGWTVDAPPFLPVLHLQANELGAFWGIGTFSAKG